MTIMAGRINDSRSESHPILGKRKMKPAMIMMNNRSGVRSGEVAGLYRKERKGVFDGIVVYPYWRSYITNLYVC